MCSRSKFDELTQCFIDIVVSSQCDGAILIIEMSGVCTESHIWSVGCTVIEILTCVPPYFDLQPMPALFTDFLRQCFQKKSQCTQTMLHRATNSGGSSSSGIDVNPKFSHGGRQRLIAKAITADAKGNEEDISCTSQNVQIG